MSLPQPENSQTHKVGENFTWQDHVYERLKVLYEVSKLLASSNGLEKIFPKVLSLLAETFPFTTAVLMENRGSKVEMTVLHADNATEEQINLSIDNAKESFIYLTSSSRLESAELRAAKILSGQLVGIRTELKASDTRSDNYIVTPLLIDQLPAFGIFQLEGTLPLDEKDLEFVDALSTLFAVAVDRYYKIKAEQELHQRETKESSEKLNRSQGHVFELEAEREMREKFVSLLTHDLRTPMTVIKMSSDLIQRRPENVAATVKISAQISASVNRAEQMIEDLLDANRIQRGERLPIKIEQADLSSLIKKTLDELKIIHGERFVLNCVETIEGYWDQIGVRRMVENLCNNAVKYGNDESPVIVTLLKKSPNVVIEVKNQGPLIPKEEQKNLFKQFYRGISAKSGNKKGWGIGLTLVRGLAEAHGGSITLQSEIETGTTFSITLPLDSRPL